MEAVFWWQVSYKLLIRYLSPLKMCNEGRQSGLKSVGADETFRDFPRLQDLEARNL